MQTIRKGFVAVAAALILAASGSSGEEKIALDKLPKAVVDALKEKYPDATLKSAEKEEEKGKTTYEVVVDNKGKKLEVILTPEGKIVAVECVIAAKDLPRAVADAVKAKYPGAVIKQVEEISKDDKVAAYEVQLIQGDKKVEATFDPKGKLLEEEK